MAKHIDLGKLGEDIAIRYLKKKKYRVIERNYRMRLGELDIVALAPDKTLVLVEVKTVSGPNPKISGEDQMTAPKTHKFRRAAEIYASGDGERFVSKAGWRTDLVTVEFDLNRETRVRHYQNI